MILYVQQCPNTFFIRFPWGLFKRCYIKRVLTHLLILHLIYLWIPINRCSKMLIYIYIHNYNWLYVYTYTYIYINIIHIYIYNQCSTMLIYIYIYLVLNIVEPSPSHQIQVFFSVEARGLSRSHAACCSHVWQASATSGISGNTLMVFNSDLMVFYSDLMGFNSDLMVFYSDLMGFYSDLMGYQQPLPSGKLTVCYWKWP